MAAGLVLLSVSTVKAQVVSGALTNGSTGEPIEGAFVRLLDEGGKAVGGALSGHDGSYSVRAPVPGQYSLRIERLGYLTEERTAFDLSEAIRLDLQVFWEPIPLQGFSVGGESRCGSPSDAGQATAILWEEARKVLDMAVWAQEELLEFEVENFQRVLNRQDRVAQETTESLSWVGAEAFSGVSPEWVEEHGFIQLVDGNQAYLGPDAGLILSDEFLQTHCFGVERSEERLGLTFEPVPERELPDIRGTLWLGAERMVLEELEFRYTSVPNRIIDGRVGGQMLFERLPGGAWVVSDWRIRIPLQWHSLDQGPPTVTAPSLPTSSETV